MSTIDVQKYEKMISAMGSIFGSKGEIVGIEGAGMNGTKDVLKANTLGEQLQEVIDVNGYGDAVQLIDNERGITIRILDNILFESGQAELGESSKTVLSKLADIMRDLPNDIRIEGHTDNVPIKTADYPSNWHLSVARATSTAYYLMNQEGMSEDKVSIVGYSEYNPVASNETPEGRALNRRVDIVILKNKK
jgi:chemotaxis protein MotB